MSAPVFIDADSDGAEDDLVFSAPFASYSGRSNCGVVYVLHNSGQESGTIDLLNTTVVDLNIICASADDTLGKFMAMGDADGDGSADDLAITAGSVDYDSNSDVGAVYIIFNINEKSGTIDLNSTPADITIYGEAASDQLGENGGIAFGDADSDGYMDDIVVQATGNDEGASGAGKVYVINDVGSRGSVINLATTDVNFTILGEANSVALGSGTPIFGDVDSDGYNDDLIIGGIQSGASNSGSLHLFMSVGLESGIEDMASPSAVDLTITGTTFSDYVGSYCKALGDVDGDGAENDLFFSGYGMNDDLGALFLIKDINGESGTITVGTSAGASIVDLNIIGSADQNNSAFGNYGCSFGDYDGDGTNDDIAFLDNGTDPFGRLNAGTVYVITNLAEKSGTIDMGSPGDNIAAYFYGASASDRLGTSSAPVFGDADSDGLKDDLVFTSYYSSPLGRANAGSIWLFDLAAAPPNSLPDINVFRIDSNPDNGDLPSFSYTQDGNLTIDFNVMDADAGNTLTVDLNYSSSNVQGTGTSIVQGLTLDATTCDDADFTDTTTCSYDFNISSTLIASDGNYFILAKISDGTDSDFNASDNNFMIDNTAPSISISSPANGTSQTETSVTIEYSGSDTNSGIASYSVSTDGTNWTDNGTATTYAFTSQSTGTNTYYARATDNAGNTNQASVSVTITAPASGGGGTTDNYEGTVKRIMSINAGQSRTTAYESDESIVSIELVAKNRVQLALLKKNEINELEENNFTKPVYKYAEILFDEQENLDHAKIEFRVKKKWVEEQGADKSDIVLLRLIKDKWVELETKLDKTTNEYHYYTAVTPGFSHFAISLREKENLETESVDQTPKEEEPQTTPEETPKETKKPATETNQQLPAQEQTPENEPQTDWTGIILALITTTGVLLIIAAITGFYLYKNKKTKHPKMGYP